MLTDYWLSILRTYGTLDAAGLAVLGGVFLITAVLPVPRTALCIGAGAVYGLAAIPVIVPCSAGAGVAVFLMARFLFASPVRRFLHSRRYPSAVMQAVNSGGRKVVGLICFASPIPFSLQNVCFAMTGVRFLDYAALSFLCPIPPIALYVAMGATGRVAVLGESDGWGTMVMAGMAIIAMTTVIVLVTQKTRAILRSAGALGEGKVAVTEVTGECWNTDSKKMRQFERVPAKANRGKTIICKAYTDQPDL